MSPELPPGASLPAERSSTSGLPPNLSKYLSNIPQLNPTYFLCFLRVGSEIFLSQVPRGVALEGEMSSGAHRITSWTYQRTEKRKLSQINLKNSFSLTTCLERINAVESEIVVMYVQSIWLGTSWTQLLPRGVGLLLKQTNFGVNKIGSLSVEPVLILINLFGCLVIVSPISMSWFRHFGGKSYVIWLLSKKKVLQVTATVKYLI